MDEKEKLAGFERHILPHLDAAFNLSRWLARNDQDAQDVVQEAFLRAFKFFSGFRGTDSRAWLLRIVRNTFYTWLHKNQRLQEAAPFDDEIHSSEMDPTAPGTDQLAHADADLLREAIDGLPTEFRESLILRELEGLSYKEIADVANVPIGTVMSRLARARQQLRLFFLEQGESKER